MNLFDVLDNLELLPKRLAGAIALTLAIGLAYVPPVRQFYLDQARERGEEIAQVLLNAWPHQPTVPGPRQPGITKGSRP